MDRYGTLVWNLSPCLMFSQFYGSVHLTEQSFTWIYCYVLPFKLSSYRAVLSCGTLLFHCSNWTHDYGWNQVWPFKWKLLDNWYICFIWCWGFFWHNISKIKFKTFCGFQNLNFRTLVSLEMIKQRQQRPTCSTTNLFVVMHSQNTFTGNYTLLIFDAQC